MVTPLKSENKIDGGSLRSYLRPSERPPDVAPEAIDDSIRKMAEAAHRRLSMNQSGGLPGPEIHRRSSIRKILDIFSRKR